MHDRNITNNVYSKNNFDIVIVGGGMVGLSLAAALKDTALKIAIIETEVPNFEWNSTQYDLRVSAINIASLNFFMELGVWPAIEKERISAYDKMFVWTENSELQFTASEMNKPELGFIIENRIFRKCLWTQLNTQENVTFIAPCKLQSVAINNDNAQLITMDQKMITAKLLVGADGAHSWLREQLKIPMNKSSYQQTALVTTVRTEHEHQHTAWQHFLPNGPLALLPLADPHYCSIVWSTTENEAQNLKSCSTEEFNQQINQAFTKLEKIVGKIELADQRLSFPLIKQHLEHYVQPRIAFIGDAAHTLHPLAGQGVNLGFRDARCLAKVIQDTLAQQKDYASLAILRKYERQQKANNALFLTAMDILKYLFTDVHSRIIPWRDRGINFLNKSTLLKKLFVEKALGEV